MRYVLDESFRENQHFMFNNLFPKNLDIYEIMWKNMVQPGRPQMTIWRMRFASQIPKATDTHSGYVILIAFPRNSGCTNLLHTSRKRVYFAVRTEYLNIFGIVLVEDIPLCLKYLNKNKIQGYS